MPNEQPHVQLAEGQSHEQNQPNFDAGTNLTGDKSRENPLNNFEDENQKLMKDDNTFRQGAQEDGTYIKNPNERYNFVLSGIKEREALNMDDPKINRVFPLKDRIMKQICCCCPGQKESWIPYLLRQPPKLTLE